MKGYKTIEEFTLDDCLKYTNSDNKNELSIQVKERYDQLLVKLQQEDDDKFYACKTKKDYQAYVDSYSSSVIGESGCGGAHISEAQDIIKKWPYRIIKFICGIILSAYLIPMAISFLYWASDVTNDFKVVFSDRENEEFGKVKVYYSHRWEHGWYPLIRFGSLVNDSFHNLSNGVTYINTSKTLTEYEVLAIAEEIMPKVIVCRVIWAIFHILCQVLVYKILIKNNLKYIITK